MHPTLPTSPSFLSIPPIAYGFRDVHRATTDSDQCGKTPQAISAWGHDLAGYNQSTKNRQELERTKKQKTAQDNSHWKSDTTLERPIAPLEYHSRNQGSPWQTRRLPTWEGNLPGHDDELPN